MIVIDTNVIAPPVQNPKSGILNPRDPYDPLDPLDPLNPRSIPHRYFRKSPTTTP